MKHPSPSISFFVELAKTQNRLTNRFDRALGGLSLTEFLVLLSLDQAPNHSLRRVELAAQIGVSASGVTRILLPMAKVHLVKDGSIADDARVRLVTATAAGREKLHDEIRRLQFLVDELLPDGTRKNLAATTEFIAALGDRAMIR